MKEFLHNSLIRRLTSSFDSVTAKGSMLLSIGLGLRMVMQSILFVLAASFLGAEQFGLFSALQAVAILGFPFANWGSGYILLKHVSRGSRSFSTMWATSFSVTLFMGGIFTIFFVLIVSLLYSSEIAIKIGLPLAFGDLIGLALVTIASQSFQSQNLLFHTSITWVVYSFLRLLSIVLLIILPFEKSVTNWSFFYGLGGFLGGIINVCWVIHKRGLVGLTLDGMRDEWTQGFYFSISVFAQGVYNNIDKTFLSRFTSNFATGIYSVSYRIVDFFSVPIQSLTFILFPKFLKQADIKNVSRLGFRILPWAFVISIGGWVAVYLLSPLFVFILGHDYSGIGKILLFLGSIIVFRSFHYLAANILAGADYQNLRSGLQVGVAGINFILNLWLIRNFGIQGAIWSSVISDGLLALGLWLLILILLRNR